MIFESYQIIEKKYIEYAKSTDKNIHFEENKKENKINILNRKEYQTKVSNNIYIAS